MRSDKAERKKGCLRIGRAKGATACRKADIRKQLEAMVRGGVKTVLVVPVSKLTKRAVLHEVPSAIEEFRRTHLDVDFHYGAPS
ncbi:MAG: hypothetical protein WC352_09485 [Candidatus Omnitrophota bacterium]|jgi:hypothetical protein